ncbi:hypothetical protein HY024_03405 [Candidatus Curtissbacteria bacterium]|nr:hypothetical protein [Candidatus Curtissbacteria bacterium]
MIQRTILATVTTTLIVSALTLVSLQSSSTVAADNPTPTPTPTPSPSSTPIFNVDQSGNDNGINIANNNNNQNTNNNNININTDTARVASNFVPRTLPATGTDLASTLALFGTIPLGLKLARFKSKANGQTHP